MPTRLADRIRFLFRLFLLFTFLAAVAVISAITVIKLTIQGNQETLPSLVGVNMDTAERIAGDMGLVVKVEDKLFSEKYAANHVISQEPPPDTKVKSGQHIHVLVSLGAPRIEVPDMVDSSVRIAQILAVEKGLTVGDLAEVHWPESEPGEIIAQDPPPSATGIRSPAINFLVSLGKNAPAYVCPNFIGMKLEQARALLTSGGFSIAKVNPTPGINTTSGTILAQSPAAGNKIHQGDSFTFQVAQ